MPDETENHIPAEARDFKTPDDSKQIEDPHEELFKLIENMDMEKLQQLLEQAESDERAADEEITTDIIAYYHISDDYQRQTLDEKKSNPDYIALRKKQDVLNQKVGDIRLRKAIITNKINELSKKNNT